MEPVNEPLIPAPPDPPPFNRPVVTEQILRICELLPPESLAEVLNFAIHELVQVCQNQAQKDQ